MTKKEALGHIKNAFDCDKNLYNVSRYGSILEYMKDCHAATNLSELLAALVNFKEYIK